VISSISSWGQHISWIGERKGKIRLTKRLKKSSTNSKGGRRSRKSRHDIEEEVKVDATVANKEEQRKKGFLRQWARGAEGSRRFDTMRIPEHEFPIDGP
jgi:hypothetical protein